MIRLGSLAGYPFDGPRLLGGWTPSPVAAVYAVMYKPEPDTKPENYAVMYVGHADDLSAERFPFRHPGAASWIKRAGSKWQLYVSFYQEWACGQGHVDASGNNNIETTGEYCNEDYQYFDWGLNVNATAGVYEGGGGYAFYGGWESADCDGGSSFSGAFSYGC